MDRFEPQPGEQVSFGAKAYEVMPHPAVPSMAFGQEGRKAIVYQLRSNGNLFALKIFKDRFRAPSLVDTCKALSRLSLSGLEVCTRQCFTHDLVAALLGRYPEMEYAVLMPWVQGSTWFDILFAGTEINEDASKQTTKNTADVLAELETRGYAHCDVAGANVIVNTTTGNVSFIDVEDMYGPGLPLPSGYPQGTAGYQHRESRASDEGQWCAAGDRFAAAVLLAEMLAWHSAEIRQASEEESYFDEAELQDPACDRYRLMVDTLAGMSTEVARCFERAWASATLADCPPLGEWAQALEFPLVAEWLPIEAPPPAAPYRPAGWTPIVVEPEPPFKPEFIDILVDEGLQPTGRLPDKPGFCWSVRAAETETRVLNWVGVPSAEGYIIQASDTADFGDAVQVYEGSETSWTDPDESQDVKYFRICAFNAHGSGEWSDTIEA